MWVFFNWPKNIRGIGYKVLGRVRLWYTVIVKWGEIKGLWGLSRSCNYLLRMLAQILHCYEAKPEIHESCPRRSQDWVLATV